MIRAPSFVTYPSHPRARAAAKTTRDATDFLRSHEQMASLLPAATRMIALQKDCGLIHPALLDTCAVAQFESGQLVLLTPNAAIAAKLKQQLPKLQEGLLKRGWQVNAIRLKVQVSRIA